MLRPTTPLRHPSNIVEAIKLLDSTDDCSSVVSVSKLNECPYKWMKISNEGYLESLFHEMSADDVNLPRQCFPISYYPNGYVDILKSETILKDNCVYGNYAVPYFTNGIVSDIDTEADIKSINRDELINSDIYKYLSKTKY